MTKTPYANVYCLSIPCSYQTRLKAKAEKIAEKRTEEARKKNPAASAVSAEQVRDKGKIVGGAL